MNQRLVEKIVGMFLPYDGDNFMGVKGSQVICGPDDRAMIGFSTNFPKKWLIEDFGFTAKEADEFIAEVKRLSRKPKKRNT